MVFRSVDTQLHLKVTSSPKEVKGWLNSFCKLLYRSPCMYAFILRYWDGRGAAWSRVTVLVHLKVVYAAVEMLLPQARHCLQAYISAQQRAVTKNKDLAQAAGTRAWNLSRPAWVHKCQLRGLHRRKDTKWHAPAHPTHPWDSLRKCPVFQTHHWPWLSQESGGCTWLPGLFCNSRSSLTTITRNHKFWPSVLSLQSTVHAFPSPRS